MKNGKGKSISDSQQKLSAVTFSYNKPYKKAITGITDCTIEESIASIKKAMQSVKIATVWR